MSRRKAKPKVTTKTTVIPPWLERLNFTIGFLGNLGKLLAVYFLLI